MAFRETNRAGPAAPDRMLSSGAPGPLMSDPFGATGISRTRANRNIGVWILATSCAVVPCVFTTHWNDVFYLPKLIVLWSVLPILGWIVGLMAARGELRFSYIWWIDLPLAFYVVWSVLSSF